MVRKPEAVSNNRDHVPQSFYYCFLVPCICGVVLCAHPIRGESHIQRQRRGCNNIPSFLQQTAPIARSFCEGLTQHDLHILVTAPFCCGRKARGSKQQ